MHEGRRGRGQVLVLGALSMLVLAIAVLTTVSLGHAVYERQRLQNTADATAYSMAALEARTFNFYAFVNRTHASHYVSAMGWQSTLSFTYFTEAFLADVYGIAATLDPCMAGGATFAAICEVVLEAIPALGAVFSLLRQIFETVRGLLTWVIRFLRQSDPDRVIGREVIPSYFAMNAVLTGAAKALFRSTAAQLESTADEVVRANDPLITPDPARLRQGQLSRCLMERIHQAEAWPDPDNALDPRSRDDRSKTARAKRSMGQMSNASRFALDGDRRPGVGQLAGWVTDRSADGLLNVPPLAQALGARLGGRRWKWGQTKLLSTSGSSFRHGRNRSAADRLSGGGNRIRDWNDPPDAPDGALAQGDDLGSDDLYRLNLGPARLLGFKNPFHCGPQDDPIQCWGDPRWGAGDSSGSHAHRFMLKTSIWASSTLPGLHHRLVSELDGQVFPQGPGAVAPNGGSQNPHRDIGLNRFKAFEPAPGVVWWKYVANVRGVEDGNHPWPGVAPFPHFEPGEFATRCAGGAPGIPSATEAASRGAEFNQPSAFVLLHRAQPALSPIDRPWMLNGRETLGIAGHQLQLGNSRRAPMGFAGMTAIARAQTYYHRPGNWHEHPNFFNPYWRPRLAAVLQGAAANPAVGAWLEELPGALAAQPQRVVTH